MPGVSACGAGRISRPYIAALSCLMRSTAPSTAPEVYSKVSPATCRTAASSSGQRPRIARRRFASVGSRRPGRAGDPTGDLPHCRPSRQRRQRRQRRPRGRVDEAQRLHVAGKGLVAAGVSAVGDLTEQHGGISMAGGEPFVQVRLEQVEHADTNTARSRVSTLSARRYRRTVLKFSPVFGRWLASTGHVPAAHDSDRSAAGCARPAPGDNALLCGPCAVARWLRA